MNNLLCRFLFFLTCLISLPLGIHAQNIEFLEEGRISLNGQEVDLGSLDAATQQVVLHKREQICTQYYNKGVSLAQEGKMAEAADAFKQVLNIHPQNLDALLGLGEVMLERDPSIAQKYFQEAVKVEPGNYKSYFGIARCLQQQNRYADALEQYEAALKLSPSHPELHYYMGTTFFGSQDYEQAIECFNQAIKHAPLHVYAYHDRGSAKRMLGQYDKAFKDYTIAIQTANQDAEGIFYNNRASLLVKMELPEQALQDYQQAIALDPENYLFYNNRGCLHFEQGDYEKAIQDFDRCLALLPQYVPACCNKGNALFKLGKVAEARAAYDRTISLDGKFANAYLNRGILRQESKDLKGACQDWQKAAELGSKLAHSYLQICEQ